MNEELVIEAQQHIINNPKRAVVNSESSFVKEYISKTDVQLSRTYWSYACGSIKNPFTNPVIEENQKILDSIDKGYTMPEWGYRGT